MELLTVVYKSVCNRELSEEAAARLDEQCPHCRVPYGAIQLGSFNTTVLMTCLQCGHVTHGDFDTKEAALAKIRSFPDAYMRRHGEHGDTTVHA
jgi:hypothetical protein